MIDRARRDVCLMGRRIKDLPVADRVSIYYMSQYALTAPDGVTKATCKNMRKDCAGASATP